MTDRIPGIRRAIAVQTRRTRAGVETKVSIDDLIPAPGMRERIAVWRVSTRPARLPAGSFANAAAVNARFTEGRALACVHLATSTTIAAVGYHIDPDESVPVLLTDAAVALDDDWKAIAHGAVLILKAYLHELGRKLGRPREVGYIASAREVDRYGRLYGFKRAAVPAAWKRLGGNVYLEQLASGE